MNKLLVASVLLCVGDMVLADGSFYDSDREDVKEIKEEVEVLNNEIQRLHDKVDRLLEAEFGKEDREIRWPPLELLNVSRTWSPLTNETTYTVCYHDYGSGDDVSVELWSDQHGSYRFEDKESEMNPEEEGKTACTSVSLISAFKVASLSIKRADVFLSYTMRVDEYEDHSWLSEYNMEEDHIRSWNSYHYISIMKERAAKANQTVTDIQLNTIQVINDGDVVYDVYQDRQAVVKVRTHFLDKYSTDNLKVHMELINSTTNTMDRTVCNLDDRRFSSSCTLLPNPKKLWDGMEVDIGIDTHIRGMMLSGYATVSVTTTIQQENEHAFLKEITMAQDVVIRPTSQPGPYPDNFLNVNLTLEDDDLKVCQINDMDLCTLHCSAKGNNIEEVNFFRTVNGTTELIPSTSDESEVPVQHNILSHRSSKSIQVPKPDVLQPEQAVQNITCSARNQDGLTASTNISVDVMNQIRIVDNETYIESNDTAVMAVCTVQGYPLANVTLKATQHFNSGTFYNYDKELYFDKIEVQQNLTSFKVKVTGYLTVNEYSSEADVKEYLYIVSVICTAEAKYSDSVFIHEYASMSRDDTS